MDFVHEKAGEVPVAGEFDVIVAGSGPAGVSAALRAARAGVMVWDALDVGASPEDIGQRGSRTRVVRTARPAKKAGCRMLDGFTALMEALEAEEKR